MSRLRPSRKLPLSAQLLVCCLTLAATAGSAYSQKWLLEPRGITLRAGQSIEHKEGFLYDAARSGKFGPIELSTVWLQRRPDGEVVRTPQILRLEPINDFKTCASAERPPFGRYQNIGFALYEPPTGGILFQPRGYAEELTAGRCVLAMPVANHSAKYSLAGGLKSVGRNKPHRMALTIVERESRREVLSDISFEQLYEAFGVQKDVPVASMQPKPAQAAEAKMDAELIRSLKQGGEPRKAAFQTIAKRYQRVLRTDENGKRSFQRVRTKKTSDDVVRAMLDTRQLAERPIHERRIAMNAFLAVGQTPHARQVLQQLFSALDRAVEDRRGPADKKWQGRVEDRLGKPSPPMGPQGKPAHQVARYFELGAQLALELGAESAEQFALHYRPQIETKILRSLALQKMTTRIAARSSYAEPLLIALLGKVAKDRRTPPVVMARVQNLIAEIPMLSPETTKLLYDQCDRGEPFFPNSNGKRSKKICGIVKSKFAPRN